MPPIPFRAKAGATSDVSRVAQRLAISYTTAIVAAIVVAGIVTWRTSAQPVTVEHTHAAPARLSPDAPPECTTGDVPPADRFDVCVLEQPRSAVFPEADAVYVLRADDAGYNGVEIASFPQVFYFVDQADGDRTVVFEPSAAPLDPDTFELSGIAQVGFPSGASDQFSGSSTGWGLGGWIYGDITTREPFKTLVENQATFAIGLEHGIQPDDGAPSEYDSAIHDQKVIVTWRDVPVQWTPIDMTDFEVPPVDPPRSVGLLAIWGTMAALLALVGAVGAIAARPALAAARRAEDRGERLAKTAFGLAHDLRSPIRAIASAGARLGRDAEGPMKTLTDQIGEGTAELRATLDRYADITGGADHPGPDPTPEPATPEPDGDDPPPAPRPRKRPNA